MTTEIQSAKKYAKSVSRVLLIVLILNLFVVLGKVIAGWLANSIGVLSDALHSSVDSLNNFIGLIVLRMAAAMPDREHPYGHGKYESLAAFSIAGLLFITCFQLFTSAVNRINNPSNTTIEITAFTFLVMIITIITNILVVRYETKRGRELSSEFLIADAVHTKSDIMVSLSVLSGMVFVKYGYPRADAIVAILVAGFIAYSGFQIFRATVPILVDAAPIDPDEIEAIISETSGVHSCHNIRSRGHRRNMFIELHLVVKDPDSEVSHKIADEVERKLIERLGPCNVTIHVEPDPGAN